MDSMNSQRRTSTGKNKKTGLEWNSFKFESNVLTRQFSRKFSSEFLNFVYQFFFIPNAKSNVPFYTGYQEWYNSFIERSIRASFVQILISAVFVFLAIFQFYSLLHHSIISVIQLLKNNFLETAIHTFFLSFKKVEKSCHTLYFHDIYSSLGF